MSLPPGSAAWWQARYEAADSSRPKTSRFLEENLPWLEVGEALDLGMGLGQNAALLAKEGYSVTGIDFCAPAVERARALFSECGVRVETLGQDLQFFLVPLMKYQLITVLDTKPPLTVLKGLARGLAPKGKLLVEGHLLSAVGKVPYPLDACECYAPQELLGHIPGLRILYYDERPSKEGIAKVRLIAAK